jgi:hypothetical protein
MDLTGTRVPASQAKKLRCKDRILVVTSP